MHIDPIVPFEKSETARYDDAEILCVQADATGVPNGLEKPIHKPMPAGLQNRQKVGHVLCSIPNAVKTADIQRQIIGTVGVHAPGKIRNEEGSIHACPPDLSPGQSDRSVRKVHSGHLPSTLGKRQNIGARPAPQVDGTPWMVRINVGKQFGRGFAIVPGRAEQVPQVEVKPTEQGSVQQIEEIGRFLQTDQRWGS